MVAPNLWDVSTTVWFLKLADDGWLRLRADYDTEVAKAVLAKTLAKIKPWAGAAEDNARAQH